MPIRLHIGGHIRHPDWKILDIESRPEVDFVGDAKDLSRFTDGSVEAIYASHVLEHFHYGLEDELLRVLREWHRVLVPSGQLMVSVPDLGTLCWLFSWRRLGLEQRHHIMRMLFGGHTAFHDVHKTGFDEEILAAYLQTAGFTSIRRTDPLGPFEDTSRLAYLGVPVSINLTAVKAPSPATSPGANGKEPA